MSIDTHPSPSRLRIHEEQTATLMSSGDRAILMRLAHVRVTALSVLSGGFLTLGLLAGLPGARHRGRLGERGDRRERGHHCQVLPASSTSSPSPTPTTSTPTPTPPTKTATPTPTKTPRQTDQRRPPNTSPNEPKKTPNTENDAAAHAISCVWLFDLSGGHHQPGHDPSSARHHCRRQAQGRAPRQPRPRGRRARPRLLRRRPRALPLPLPPPRSRPASPRARAQAPAPAPARARARAARLPSPNCA